tara:strand:- start:575 stop:823 length:249 start_codon:yes stop_codon:yes gene_type:complete
MKANGIIEIEKGLELNNPTLKIKSVQYEQFDNRVVVECYFNEEGSNFKHSRSYEFINDTEKDLTYSDILSFVNSHNILKAFK